MSRSLSETGTTGRIDPYTTGRDESALAKRFRTHAQLKALGDTGVKTELFERRLHQTIPGVLSLTETKPR